MQTETDRAAFRPARDLAGLRRLLGRPLERWLALPDGELFKAPGAPEEGRWSAGHHLFHLSLAAELSLENVLALVNRTGALRRELVSRLPETDGVLVRGRIPRGVRAPRFVTPPPRLARDQVEGLVADARAAVERVAPVVGRAVDAPLCIPHQLLGDLDAPRWVRFARVHTAHHLAVLRAGV